MMRGACVLRVACRVSREVCVCCVACCVLAVLLDDIIMRQEGVKRDKKEGGRVGGRWYLHNEQRCGDGRVRLFK